MMTMNGPMDINEQAAAWMAKLLDQGAKAFDRQSLNVWRAADPAQDQAYAELEALVADLDTVGEQVLELEMVQELEAAVDARRRQRFVTGISAMAATVCAAVMTTVTLWSPMPDADVYETLRGERLTVTLEDGSAVELNTDTKVRATMEDGERHVTIERGEAFFNVTRDENRPFVVTAGRSEVRVLGTKFNVRLGASSNMISVLSGLVSVSQHNSGDVEAKELALLQAGQQAEHQTSVAKAIIESFDANSVFAWRTGKAFYSEMPLEDVVADLNRYFKDPLKIADASLAELPVSGTFNLNDQNVVVDALESAFSLMAVKRVDGVILLYSRQEQ